MLCFNVTPVPDLTFGASFGTSWDSSEVERNRNGRISAVIESIDMYPPAAESRHIFTYPRDFSQAASAFGCDEG